jgi:hypothetical protein
MFLLHSVQTGSGTLPAASNKGTETDHSRTPSVEVKNGSAVPPLTHMPSWLSAYLYN